MESIHGLGEGKLVDIASDRGHDVVTDEVFCALGAESALSDSDSCIDCSLEVDTTDALLL